jgi:hypothetical protein
VKVSEFVCDCKGFEYRGTCSHQGKALDMVCWWPLGAHQQEQEEWDEKYMICPNCGGPTKWEMVNAETEE